MQRLFKILKNSLLYGFLLLSLTIFLFSLYSHFSLSDKSIFNCQAFIVRSDSMAATDFKAGDIIVIKTNNYQSLKTKDIITFYSQGKPRQVISHKIRKIDKNINNQTLYTTYGSSSNVDDQNQVKSSDIIGKYLFKIPKLGYIVALFKNRQTYLILLITGLTFMIIFLFTKLINLNNIKKREKGA